MNDPVEIERSVLKELLDMAEGGYVNDRVISSIRMALWKPYDPCPVCGSQSAFGERVVVDSPVSVVQTGDHNYPDYTDPTYGETIELECHNCNHKLISDGEKLDAPEPM